LSSSIFGHLQASLRGYLTDVTSRVQSANEVTAANLARCELPRVVAALRAVLDEHQPDAQGRCHACKPRRFGRPPAPCRAYLTAHLCLLINEDGEPRPSGTRITAADLSRHLGHTG